MQAGNSYLPPNTINASPGLSCYLGELRLFPFIFQGSQWLPADGRVLAINTNQILFSIIGTEFGGEGTATFLSCRIIAVPPPTAPSIKSASETLSIRSLESVITVLAGGYDSGRTTYGSLAICS